MTYPLHGLAILYSDQGKYEQAEPLFERALRIWEQALGPHHPHTVKTRTTYADLLREMGHADEAIALEADVPD